MAEEKEETQERDAQGGKGGRVFRKKPGGTKRLCRCPVRPAFPPGHENLPSSLPPAPHPTLTSALLPCPLRPLILSHIHTNTHTFIWMCHTCKDFPLDYFKPIKAGNTFHSLYLEAYSVATTCLSQEIPLLLYSQHVRLLRNAIS